MSEFDILSLSEQTERLVIGNIDIPLVIQLWPNINDWDISRSKNNNQIKTNDGWIDIHNGNNRAEITLSGKTYQKIGLLKNYKAEDVLFAGTKQAVENFNIFKENNKVLAGSSQVHGPSQWAQIDLAFKKLEKIYYFDKEPIGSAYEAFQYTYSELKDLVSPLNDDETTETQSLTSKIKNNNAKRASSFLIFRSVIYFGYFLNFQSKTDASQNFRITSFNMKFRVVDTSEDFVSRTLMENFPEARMLNLFPQIKNLAEISASLVLNADNIVKSIFI